MDAVEETRIERLALSNDAATDRRKTRTTPTSVGSERAGVTATGRTARYPASVRYISTTGPVDPPSSSNPTFR